MFVKPVVLMLKLSQERMWIKHLRLCSASPISIVRGPFQFWDKKSSGGNMMAYVILDNMIIEHELTDRCFLGYCYDRFH
jgi:hypothetical protein